jgi:hypothetical protein
MGPKNAHFLVKTKPEPPKIRETGPFRGFSVILFRGDQPASRATGNQRKKCSNFNGKAAKSG